MPTLANFRSIVASKIGLDNTTAGDQGFIDNWCNEGVSDILMRTRCRVLAATQALIAGTKDYTLDTNILLIVSAYVTTAGIDYWLERTSLDEILAMRRTTTANVSPAQFYAVAGSNLLMIYPTPAAADTLNFYYVPRPATLALSSDTPSEIPVEFHKAVEYYALAQAGDYDDDDSSQNGATYMQQYELWIRRMKKWVALKGHHRLGRASVRRSPATIPFHDRSRYPGGEW